MEIKNMNSIFKIFKKKFFFLINSFRYNEMMILKLISYSK